MERYKPRAALRLSTECKDNETRGGWGGGILLPPLLCNSDSYSKTNWKRHSSRNKILKRDTRSEKRKRVTPLLPPTIVKGGRLPLFPSLPLPVKAEKLVALLRERTAVNVIPEDEISDGIKK